MNKNQKIKWQIRDVFYVFIATFLLEFLVFLILRFFGVGDIIENIEHGSVLRSLLLLLLYMLQIFAMLLPLWFFVLRKYKSKIKDFGFYWIGTWKTILWTFAAYIFYIGLGTIIIIIFFYLGIGFLGFEPQTSIFEIFGREPFGILVSFFIAIFAAPFIEEIFFRGFMLQTLIKEIGAFWAVTLTALIFASVHFEFQSIMPLLILSVVLNVLYVKTKSIWPGVIFHIMNNSIAFVVTYFLENQFIL